MSLARVYDILYNKILILIVQKEDVHETFLILAYAVSSSMVSRLLSYETIGNNSDTSCIQP